MRVLLLLVILASTACTIFKKKDTENDIPEFQETVVSFDLDKIRERGKLIAIVDNSSTGYFIYKGQPMGYEHDLLQRFCREIDVDLEIKVTRSIDEAVEMLNSGEGDLIAYFMTITRERKARVDFTDKLTTTRQVLVQKKPNGWQRMWPSKLEKSLLRNPVDLIGKEVTVRQSSSFVQRLNNLSDEIGGDIIIIEESKEKETEDLIKEVQNEAIPFTVADEQIALINASYYPDLDVNTALSFPQQIAWAIRKESPLLRSELNKWIAEIQVSSFHQIIYNKYFKITRKTVERAQSDFSSISGNRISQYDDLIKAAADRVGWDWKLVASLMYQESRFNPRAVSWVGARGLMQVMPRTGARFGATDLFNPGQNIKAGADFIEYLDRQWAKKIEDSVERKKFILASYNAGLGHVQDAAALSESLGNSPIIWEGNVREAMKLKSNPQYYRREVVKYGYARGESVVNYVDEILARFEQYKFHFPEVVVNE